MLWKLYKYMDIKNFTLEQPTDQWRNRRQFKFLDFGILWMKITYLRKVIINSLEGKQVPCSVPRQPVAVHQPRCSPPPLSEGGHWGWSWTRHVLPWLLRVWLCPATLFLIFLEVIILGHKESLPIFDLEKKEREQKERGKTIPSIGDCDGGHQEMEFPNQDMFLISLNKLEWLKRKVCFHIFKEKKTLFLQQ